MLGLVDLALDVFICPPHLYWWHFPGRQTYWLPWCLLGVHYYYIKIFRDEEMQKDSLLWRKEMKIKLNCPQQSKSENQNLLYNSQIKICVIKFSNQNLCDIQFSNSANTLLAKTYTSQKARAYISPRCTWLVKQNLHELLGYDEKLAWVTCFAQLMVHATHGHFIWQSKPLSC